MPPLKVEIHASEANADAPVAASAKATASTEELEVDYDHDITRLYEAITNEDWDAAIAAVASAATEARTWVVRHHPDGTIMWRFLPLHSACARQPPAALVSALLDAYRPAAATCDDQGLYPLHYAAGNQASSAVVKTLLLNHPAATAAADPTGLLPLHYLAKWGPADKLCLDILLLTNQDAVLERTEEGETPLQLALEGEYDEEMREAVITTLRALSGETADDEDEEEVELGSLVGAPTDEYHPNEDDSTPPPPPSATMDSFDDSTYRRYKKLERDAMSITTETSHVSKVKAVPFAVKTPRSSNLDDLKQIYVLEKEIAVLKDERETIATAHIQEVATEKASLRGEVLHLQEQMDDLAAAHRQELADEKAALKGEILQLQEQIADLTVANDELTREQSNKDEFLRYIEGRLAEKDYEMRQAQKTAVEVTAELAEIKTEHAALRTISDANAPRFATLESSARTLLAEHDKIAAALAKRDALFKAATQRRQKKMQELINMEVELTKEAVADAREGDGSYLDGAIERQLEELSTVRTTVEEAIAGVVPEEAAGEEEI
eukprot:CAMPEP_0185801222 /NCGR_PEP_ID=MMETSP1322-20130828/1318_1 /TAXON_ID=265543 /ORGANISM="Minutocellus polymorphus, Strain RCC2270" /LENGTH=553 /DNA_ID=CAMNT_0028496911 /DNA_START=230 /DNA_END=1891 /DNA_ORIENTATION=+